MVRGDKSGTKEIDFYYDHNGMRTRKVVRENGREETTDYTLHGKLITHLTKRVVDLDGVETSEELHFFYDAQSRPAMVEYNGAMYSYLHNLQGDIIGIVDSSGNLVVEYKYDAWGKPIYEAGSLLSSLGNLNPFRYRGYVWDEETELYYLRSRYYVICCNRFLNSDGMLGKNGRIFDNNLYCYCFNNPIEYTDSTGRYPGEEGNKSYIPKTINPFKVAGSEDNRNYSLLFSVKRVTYITQNDANAYNEQNAKAVNDMKMFFGVLKLLVAVGAAYYGGSVGSALISKLPVLKSLSTRAQNTIAALATGVPELFIEPEIEGANPIVAGTYNVYVAVYGIQTAEGNKYFVGKYIDAPAGGYSSWNYFPFEADSFSLDMAWDMAVVS